MRDQLKARKKLLAKDDLPQVKALVKASADFVKKLDELEEKFHNPKAEVVYDILAMKGGAKVYSQLGWLHQLVTSGRTAVPQGIVDVYREQAAMLKKCQDEWQARQKELEDLNKEAKRSTCRGAGAEVTAQPSKGWAKRPKAP